MRWTHWLFRISCINDWVNQRSRGKYPIADYFEHILARKLWAKYGRPLTRHGYWAATVSKNRFLPARTGQQSRRRKEETGSRGYLSGGRISIESDPIDSLDRSTLKALTKRSKRQAAIANLRLALLDVDPVGAIAAVKLEQILISQKYSIMMGGSFRLGGEKVTITIQNTSTGELFPITTTTVFPRKTFTSRKRKLSKKIIRPALLTDQNLVSPLSQYLFSLTPRPDMANLVTTKSSDLLRAAALVNVASKQFVESVYNDPSLLVRRVAVERLTNQSLLEQLALNEENKDIRSSAVHKIDNAELLQRLSTDKTANESVRWAAQLRLKVLELLK